MKLTPEQVSHVMHGLNILAQSVGPNTAREIEALLNTIETNEVHLMRRGLLEDVNAKFNELCVLHDKMRVTVNTYIEHVQRVCTHQFWKPDPNDRHRVYPRRIKLDSCRLCGKAAEPVTDTLRVSSD
jgi:hypothetical protein